MPNALLAAVIALGASAATAAEAPYRVPVNLFAGEPRGPYQTGTFEELWIDSARGEPTTSDPNDKRHLMVQVWYPASFKGDPQRAGYVLNRELYAHDDARKWMDDAKNVRTLSVLNAEVSKEPAKFPVLIYNPGGGHPHFSATFQTEFLASHGYIVVGVGHTGINRINRFTDGTEYKPDVNHAWLADAKHEEVLEEARTFYGADSADYARISGKAYTELTDMDRYVLQRSRFIRSVMPMYVQDISFVLDKLKTLNETRGSRFYQRLDLDKVGSLGWSLGGALSIQATRDEPRVKAGINLDGWLYTNVAESGTKKPIMMMHGESMALTAQPDQPATSREMGLMAAQLMWHMYANTPSDWYDVTVQHVGHGHFSDRTLLEASDPGSMHPRQAHDIVNRFTLEFFDKYLRGATDSPLLTGKKAYPDVRLITSEASRKPADK